MAEKTEKIEEDPMLWLLKVISCSRTSLDIDFEKLVTLGGAPTLGAAKKRVQRFEQAHGIKFKDLTKPCMPVIPPKKSGKRKKEIEIDDEEPDLNMDAEEVSKLAKKAMADKLAQKNKPKRQKVKKEKKIKVEKADEEEDSAEEMIDA